MLKVSTPEKKVSTPEPLERPTTFHRKTLPSEVIVRLQDVSKVYDDGTACLQDVNLNLKRGDFIFITGTSGAGKSTLLKLLYGEELPSAGRVYVNGFDVDRLKGDRLAKFRRRIGIVFQDYKLIPNRTVAENIAFVLQAQGKRQREIERRLLPTLKMVGLSHKADCFPARLSGGEQQRVSIARAIVGTPPLLLADEPTGNLDMENAEQILRTLQNLNTYGATIIVTTHDRRWAALSERPILQLHQGQLYWVKKP